MTSAIRSDKIKNMDTKKEPEVYWIVSEGNEVEDGEFGVEIDGVPYFYYKWPDASPSPTVKYRRINKREFGEVIRRPGQEST